MYDEMLGVFTLSIGSPGPKVGAVRVKVRGCPGQSLGSPGRPGQKLGPSGLRGPK